jgi:hypothetical protein
MPTSYIVRIRNRAGARQYDVTDFLALNYSKYLNGYGLLNVDLPGNHQAIAALEKDGQIEIWRFDDSAGITPYCDFFGLYRDRNIQTPREALGGIYTIKCVEQKQYLWRAVDGFAAGTNLRNDFTADAAETCMKLMVQYNATADATTGNGRKRTIGAWANNITVESDAAGGNSITKAFAHRRLGEALQELAVLGDIDFDLVKTGARAWQFRTYAPLGSDLTATVKFSRAWDNLDEPSLVGNAIDEETVAMVWGEGEGSAREFTARTSANHNTDWNDVETYVDARNQVSASLAAAGDVRLNEMRARDDFRFNILQSGAYRYGRDYCISGVLGDLVSVTYYEGTGTKRIRGAQVAVGNSSGGQNNESIRLDMVSV